LAAQPGPTGGHRNDAAPPVYPHQRHIPLGEPGEDVERDVAASVQDDDDALGDRKLAFEEAIVFLLLRMMREAIPNGERAPSNAKRNAVAAKDQRFARALTLRLTNWLLIALRCQS
jgi:hypothetical protein